jgi:hypothetical protein
MKVGEFKKENDQLEVKKDCENGERERKIKKNRETGNLG